MRNSLRRNSAWLLFARLTAHGFALLFVVAAARRLDVNVFGHFTFISALIVVGNSFTTFGTDTYLIREIAAARRVTALAGRALSVQIGLSALWWLATLVLRPEPPLLVYTLNLFPLALISVSSALLRAFERMDLFWVINLGNGASQVLIAILSPDLWTLCVLLLLGQVALAGLALILCARALPGFGLLLSTDLRSLLSTVWPFAAMTTLAVFAQRLGILSVAVLAGNSATGLFSSAVRLVEGLKLGHYAVLGALLPALSRNSAGSQTGFREGFVVLLIASLLLSLAVMLLAGPIIALLFGPAYSPAARLLPVLIWGLVPYTVSAFISVDMVSRGKEQELLRTMLISLPFFLVPYYFLIRALGIVGAAWASLIGETLQAALLAWISGTFTPNRAIDVKATREIL